MRKKKWIQEAIKNEGVLERYFNKKLNIPIKEKIPYNLLEKIKTSKVGDIIILKYKNKKTRIKVTKLLKKRVTLALTLKKIRRK